MKGLTINLMLAAAALTVASTAASAQTVKAEIPFEFQYRGKVLPAGTYTVTESGINPWIELANVEARKKVFITARVPEDPQKEWLASSSGVLQFTCRDDGCVLTRIWTNSGRPANWLPEPKARRQGPTHVAVIRATAAPEK